MIKDWNIWTPENSKILCRSIGLFLLCLLWLTGQGSEVGIVLLLFLIIMALIRWRFPLPGWVILLDQVACMIVIPFWPYSIFALALALFEGSLVGKPWYALPAVVFLFYSGASIPLIATFLQAGFTGWIIRGWTKETSLYRHEADQQRRQRYELENLKSELLLANVQGIQMAELAERNRIAQELHDDVGHEITAAVLAFQAFEQLWRDKDPFAEEMFLQAQKRLTNSAKQLRETVYNMKPVQAIGIDRLKDISNRMDGYPLEFSVYGDTSSVPVYLWSILEPCLKEALTNVIRHAEATKIMINLDVSPYIVRLSVYNDGIRQKEPKVEYGVGLRNLRQRARAVGGNISIDASDGFRLICVLPLEKH
ncbi:sensor histidine kinase [Alkaliphilus transvaalensis]|uniref:sensor histidine kinase n=1 Tax=Alkaliphilus transvaalensis TaxID=114628 RepID=UPI00047D28BF|nr:histidine kinase [Alkaliphilus transvaalensis]